MRASATPPDPRGSRQQKERFKLPDPGPAPGSLLCPGGPNSLISFLIPADGMACVPTLPGRNHVAMLESDQPARFLDKLKDPNNVWTRVFILITAFLFVLFLLLLWVMRPIQPHDQWLANLRTHHGENPGDSRGVGTLLSALRPVEWKELNDLGEDLRLVATLQSQPTDPILQLLSRHTETFRHLSLLASGEGLQMPVVAGRIEPVPRPDLRQMERFAHLLAANGATKLLGGSRVEAVERSLDMLTVGAMLCQPRESATLTLHLAGYFLMEGALPVLELSIESLGGDLDRGNILERIDRVEELRAPISEAILAEIRLNTDTIQANSERPERLADVLQYYDPELGRADALAEAFTLLHHAISIGNETALLLPDLERILRSGGESAPVSRNDLITLMPNPLMARQLPDIRALEIRERNLLRRLAGVRELVASMNAGDNLGD